MAKVLLDPIGTPREQLLDGAAEVPGAVGEGANESALSGPRVAVLIYASDDAAARDAAVVALDDLQVRVGEGRDLRQVGHDEDLVGAR